MIHYPKHLFAKLPSIMNEELLVASTRTPFEKLTAIHPNRRITLETGPAPVSMRLMDLFVPLGFGQRALVVAPPQAGKTTILRQIAAAIQNLHVLAVSQSSGPLRFRAGSSMP